jgi:hypothetical protein
MIRPKYCLGPDDMLIDMAKEWESRNGSALGAISPSSRVCRLFSKLLMFSKKIYGYPAWIEIFGARNFNVCIFICLEFRDLRICKLCYVVHVLCSPM